MRPRTSHAILLFALGFAAGCVSSPGGPADDDDSAGDGEGQTHAVVTTTDFSVGALVTVSLDTHEVQEVTAISSDPFVRVDAGLVFLINRWMFDSVRVYEPTNLQQPLVEFSTGAGSNPHDAVLCKGAIFVSRYDVDSLGVYDLDTGIPLDEIDLSAWADEDGSPEASTLVRKGGTLYVGLQRMIREGSFWPADPDGGGVLEIDCATREVVRSWTTGPNVSIQPHPQHDDALLLLEGVFMDESGAVALDGAIRTLDLDEEAPGAVELDEATVGRNIVSVAADDSGRGLLISADLEEHHIHSLDLITGELEELVATSAYIPAVRVNDRGEAWVVRRAPPDDLEAGGGLAVYDLETYEEVAWNGTNLEPFSIDFF